VPPDLAMLNRASDDFGARLRSVRDDQWGLATPCTDWTVRDLVNHVVVGGHVTAMLVHGATADEVIAQFGRDAIGDDAPGAFEASVAGERAAFAEPGAMERIVHHPAGDIPGSMLLGFRFGDNVLHTWDLCRALGADETLAPDLVAASWELMEPMAAMIPSFGVFGTGPSGLVGDDAPLQTRLLDLSGRRP
jgi:uncharacterized protein (TIGR03086 family)